MTTSLVLPIFSFGIMYIDVEIRFLIRNYRNDIVVFTFQDYAQKIRTVIVIKASVV